MTKSLTHFDVVACEMSIMGGVAWRASNTRSVLEVRPVMCDRERQAGECVRRYPLYLWSCSKDLFLDAPAEREGEWKRPRRTIRERLQPWVRGGGGALGQYFRVGPHDEWWSRNRQRNDIQFLG